MSFKRASGILLHVTSLPGRFGIGDLGAEAYRFVDFLKSSGQSLWQVLPLGPTSFGDSPYQCLSALAGNPLLISPDKLFEAGLLSAEDLKRVPEFPAERIDFGPVIEYKKTLLARAAENFRRTADTGARTAFAAFCRKTEGWLEDYAFFRALKAAHGGRAWNAWDRALALRDPGALASTREDLHGEIEAEKIVQYLFFNQWSGLKDYCRAGGISIIGDMPIFVAYDSADVWASPGFFKLNDEGRPTVVAGVPPDYFSATGQLWGNPLYNWEAMRADGYRWWIERIGAALQTVDIIRVDHFRGFGACWEIPGEDKTAERGQWVQAPGREVFLAIKAALGDLPIIAEDLGVITPDVEALRDELGLPGMRVLQFAFSSDSRNHDLPHNYIRNTVVYTGTHDNDTAVGWWNSKPGAGSTRNSEQIERERRLCTKYLRSDGSEIHWDFIAAALASVADTAIVPLQDVLGLGSSARMNLPARQEGNWGWRFETGALAKALGERLKELSELYGRNLL